MSAIALFFLLAMALYIPPVQNFIVRRVAAYVSENTGIALRMERVRLAFPLDLAIIRPFARQGGDTLLDARSIRAGIAVIPLFKQEVDITGLDIRDCEINTAGLIDGVRVKGRVGALRVESRGIDLKRSAVRVNRAALENSRLCIELSETAEEDTASSTGTAWKIRADKLLIENSSASVRMPGDSMRATAEIGSLRLRDGDFDLGKGSYGAAELALRDCAARYDIPFAAYGKGFDANHIHVSDLNAALRGVLYNGGAAAAEVAALRLKEKSGLALGRLSGKFYMDSTRLSLSGFEAATARSSFKAAVTLSRDALKRGGAGRVAVRAAGALDFRDVETAAPGILSGKAGSAIPSGPLQVRIEADGSRGAVKIKAAELYAKGMFRLRASGTANGILEKGRNGSVDYSLDIQDASLFANLTGGGIAIPHGTSVKGKFAFAKDAYSTNSAIQAGKGRISVNGSCDTGKETYAAKIDSRQFPLGSILKSSSLHDLTARLDVSGRGFDLLSQSSALRAEAKVRSFAVSDYDLSNTEVQAALRRGAGKMSYKAENDFINSSGEVAARFGKKGITATVQATAAQIDARKFTGKADTLFLAAKVNAGLRANAAMTAYGLNAALNDIKITTSSGVFPAKDLNVKFGSGKDSLYAALASGDLGLRLLAEGDISRVSTQAERLATLLVRQIEEKAVDQDALRRLLPDIDLYVSAGDDNPVSNILNYASGYKFDSLQFRLACDSAKGVNGEGRVCSFSTGTLLLDTIGIRISQDTSDAKGIRINGTVRNVSKGNPYLFKARLNGYFNDGLAKAEFVYTDKDGREGVNFGVRADLVDSGMKVHFYPETIVMAYRKFKVNKDNYVSLEKSRNILADLDLLADDGTGLTLHSSVKDSTNDITLKAVNVNLGELTSALPYMPAVSGFLSSDIHVTNKNREATAAFDVNAKTLSYENVPIGDIGMNGMYIPSGQEGAHSLVAFITRDGNEIAEINGAYLNAEDSLAAKLSLIRFPLDMLNGFTGETFSLSGNLAGELNMTGKAASPLLNGTVRLDSVHVYSDIYGFNFNVQNDSARITGSRMQMEDLQLYSTGSNPLVVNGGVDFSDFSRVLINIRADAANFELVNAAQTKKSEVFGKVYSDISTSVQGTADNLRIIGSLNILPATNVSYVLKDSPLSAENRLNELVSFVDFSDTAEAAEPDVEAGGIDMTLAISISDAARLHCDISEDKQSYVDIEGGGQLTFRYTRQGEVILTGKYTANSGEMKYALPVIPLRTFYLTRGSYIEFTGNPMNPTLNIQAKERIKASVTENDASRSVAFDAGISITQPLAQMGLQFTLEAPEDQTVQNQLAAMSPEQRNKLAISMLATGMYLEESNTSNGFKANNALNAFLQSEVQQIAGSALKTIDLSVNVEEGTSETGAANTDYSFRFAKRFWGNRVNVIIGGRVSTGEDARNDAASFIDNVSLEYRLDNSASRYIRLFYDNNKYDPLEGQLTEMGAGLVLRRKTDTFGEIFLWKNKDRIRRKDEGAVPAGSSDAARPPRN